jgi:hypothetical protein
LARTLFIRGSLIFLLSGCGSVIEHMSPEAQLEIAKREISIRAVGLMGVNPMTGDVVCVICWVDYRRNAPLGPPPFERK